MSRARILRGAAILWGGGGDEGNRAMEEGEGGEGERKGEEGETVMGK